MSQASDDGAAFAVAQRVRSDVGALTSVNQQLGGTQGLLTTTVNSLTSASGQVNTLRQTLENVANTGVDAVTHANYVAQYSTEITQLKGYFQDSIYEGKTLVGNLGGNTGFGSVHVTRNEVGGTYGIGTFSGSAFSASLALNSTTATTTGAAALLTAGGTFIKKLNLIGTQLNAYGASQNYVSNQITFNNNKIDALNSGLGSLIDADLAKESAQLQALQIKQQLGVQSLSLANQAPQTLLSLFK